MRRKICLPMVAALCTITAQAELPLSLEGVSPQQRRMKLGLSMTYYNRNADVYTQGSNYFLTPQNTLIEIPTRLQTGEQNTDMLYGNLSFQYGLSENTEIYTNLGAFWQQNRYTMNNLSLSDNKSELAEITLGLNHVLLRDGANPMLIGVVETAALEKIGGGTHHGKSWFVGINAYKAIDPVVFSLNAGYRFHLKHNDDYRLGNYWLVRPGVSFAANDRVSFNAKLQWIGKQGDRINGTKQAFETNSRASIGVGYAVSAQTSLSADAQWHLSGNEGSNITFALQHRF
ncbi:hypothetical protein [Suttonella indologenes]|uniref:Protein involved in meta-pathway of phenol degradation n=1 Tax=Suttonella indologenes TaxID=13276 RepID=A0A380MXF7_9GAMM|nr:hypothetical protein [Suttonella indologenes]SUO96874.1 Uncharacterised protein [Suttonella indologenes]